MGHNYPIAQVPRVTDKLKSWIILFLFLMVTVFMLILPTVSDKPWVVVATGFCCWCLWRWVCNLHQLLEGWPRLAIDQCAMWVVSEIIANIADRPAVTRCLWIFPVPRLNGWVVGQMISKHTCEEIWTIIGDAEHSTDADMIPVMILIVIIMVTGSKV